MPGNARNVSVPETARSVITIGSFDGVHRGHAALVSAARKIAAGAGGSAAAGGPVRVIAMAFDPHPLELVNPGAAPARLTRFEEREKWLLEAGADEVVRLRPTPERLGQSAAAFIEGKVSKYRPIAFVEGNDFRFGKGREGDVELLARLGSQHGFRVEVVESVEVVLDDHHVVKASSTLCRWLVQQGRVRDVATVMGRRYRIGGEVVRGDRRGRTIGFPTANIATEVLLPADGVYAARAVLPDGRVLPAAVNIGERPTFAGAARTVEAHVIVNGGATSANGPNGCAWAPLTGLAEYGWRIELEMVGWVRDQFRFAGVGALKEQLARDCGRVVEMVAALDGAGAAGGVGVQNVGERGRVEQGACA